MVGYCCWWSSTFEEHQFEIGWQFACFQISTSNFVEWHSVAKQRHRVVDVAQLHWADEIRFARRVFGSFWLARKLFSSARVAQIAATALVASSQRGRRKEHSSKRRNCHVGWTHSIAKTILSCVARWQSTVSQQRLQRQQCAKYAQRNDAIEK